jgi:hypothetical protein
MCILWHQDLLTTRLNFFLLRVHSPWRCLENLRYSWTLVFCTATEANDDDGLPHTLEHLVFMGSEDYPYKGVLDLLATRCLSPGTNAWTGLPCVHCSASYSKYPFASCYTWVRWRMCRRMSPNNAAIDHTCYTMTTAGTDGFCNLLPIYLDHMLYPLLTVRKSALSSNFFVGKTSKIEIFLMDRSTLQRSEYVLRIKTSWTDKNQFKSLEEILKIRKSLPKWNNHIWEMKSL